MKIYAVVRSGKKKGLKIKSKLTNKDVRELSAPPAMKELSLVSAGVRIFEAVLRVILSLTAVFFAFFLFSCTSVYGYSEPEDRFAVSSLGFDMDGDVYFVSARTVSGTEDARVFLGEGETVDSAMAHLKGADEKGLELSHLAVVVVGDGIGASEMREIFDYCGRNRDITIGVRFAASHSAKELLSSPEGDGYKMTGALRSGKDGSGYSRGSRFYEIENSRLEGYGFHIPYFSEWEEGYTLDGLKLYTAKGISVRLDRSESAYYMMIKGLWAGGAVDLEYGDREYSIYAGGCNTSIRSEDEKTVVKCELEINSRQLPTDDVDGLMRGCSERATELCQRLIDRYGELFFGGSGDVRVEIVAE